MTKINGLTIPDAGSTVQYIPDPIGGWLYTIRVQTTVQQTALSDIQKEIATAQDRIASDQALIAELSPHVATLVDALKVDSASAEVATSTPIT